MEVVAAVVEQRRLDVLRAIVEDYVATREPVGSKMLVERHHLGVSPATIRNDMAVLEQEGYISAPHTSAGRVPTDRGYRLFVDRLAQVKPLSAPERRAIETLLDGAVNLDDVVSRTVRLLAQLTRQVAVMQYPTLSNATLRHVELVPLGVGLGSAAGQITRILAVVIADTGRVEQGVIDLPQTSGSSTGVDEPTLSTVHRMINATLTGRRLPEVACALPELALKFPPAQRAAVSALSSALLEVLGQARQERLALAGTANLARFGTDFPDSISPVLDALEEHVVILRLLGEMGEPLTVRIGQETHHEALADTAVVSSSYGEDAALGAKVGVLGPKRMDYPSTMAVVSAVARYVGSILHDSQQDWQPDPTDEPLNPSRTTRKHPTS